MMRCVFYLKVLHVCDAQVAKHQLSLILQEHLATLYLKGMHACSQTFAHLHSYFQYIKDDSCGC